MERLQIKFTKKIYIWMAIAFVLPIVFQPISLLLSAGINMSELLSIISDPIMYIAFVLVFMLSVLWLRLLESKLSSNDLSESGVKKSNNFITFWTFASIALIISTHFAFALFYHFRNISRGILFEAFAGENTLSYELIACMGTTGMLATFPFAMTVSYFEKEVAGIPFRKEHLQFLFWMRELSSGFFAFVGIVFPLVSIFMVPINKDISNRELIFSKLIPCSLVATNLGLLSIWSPVRDMTIVLKKTIAFSNSLASGNYNIPPEPVIARYESGLVLNSLNTFLTTSRNVLENIKATIDSSNTNAKSLVGAIDEMISNIYKITDGIGVVQEEMNNQSVGINETNASITQIMQNIQSLHQAVQDQSTSIQESSASVDEMIANINSMSNMISKNRLSITELTKSIDIGKDVIGNATNTASEISKRSEAVLEASNIIQSIASQTNLLAMNAAIEAAHAGESGKGFAVVADEIRKLAEESSSQGKNISTTLKQLSSAILDMSKDVNTAKEKFDFILKLADEVQTQESIIMNALEEQASGNSQVLEAMRVINDSTTQVKDNSNEMISGSKQILVEMTQLSNLTKKIHQLMASMLKNVDSVQTQIDSVKSIADQTTTSANTLSNVMTNFKL